MQKNAPKLIFLLIAAAAIIFWRAEYPAILPSGNVSTTATAAADQTGSQVTNSQPLSANISAQDSVVSSSNQGGDSTNTASGTPTTAGYPAGNPPGVDDAVSLVADLSTGSKFLSVNADERWPLASVSKLMTAVIATDMLPPDDRVTITAQMTAADPSEHILQIGDTYTVSDLLRVMLLPSNNVAAEALAQFAGRPAFVVAMNAKAQSWGMTDTFYDDPSGLSAANESTADDLLKLAQNIYTDYPQILAITRMPEATAMNLTTNQSVTVKSINDFAGTPDFIGGKTGYTDQADGNLLSIFDYQGRPILIVVLGISDGVRFNGTQTLYNWFKTNFN